MEKISDQIKNNNKYPDLDPKMSTKKEVGGDHK